MTYVKWFNSDPTDTWLTVAIIVAFVIMFITALVIGKADAHETHLSGAGDQTVTSSTPCPILSGYLIVSEERGCFLIYQHKDFSHRSLHIQDKFPLDENDACACPSEPKQGEK